MRRARFAVGLAVALCSAAGASNFDLPPDDAAAPFDLRAARLEYTNETVYASGGVTGRFEKVRIQADQLSANPVTGDLHIEGNIQFERGKMLWQGEELDYNFIQQTGVFGPSALYFEPAYMSVDHVERVSTNEYLLRGATFSTCPLVHPHVHAKAREVRLVDEKYVKAKGVTFYIGKVPVFYVPTWRHKLNEGVFSYKFGHSSEWGGYVHTKVTLPVTQSIDSITDVNLYGDRGIGLGQGFSWDGPPARGAAQAFYLNDSNPYGRYDTALDRKQIDRDRYRLKLEHIQSITEFNYINTKWNYLSDPVVLDEFLKSEYRYTAHPENFGSWVYGNGSIGSEVFTSTRLNDFYDNTDRVEYSADLYQKKLGKLPLYLQSENSVAHLNRGFAETNPDSDYSSVRIDSANTLYLPQRYGALNVVPRASYRATYYSKSAAVNGSGEEVRHIPGAGLEISVQATKVLSEQSRWYGQGLRHKVEPYADYSYESSSVSTNRLRPFDSIDRLDDANQVKIGLRNVLQTKREGRTSRFIDLDLYTYYLVERHGAPEKFSNLYFDARMPLSRHWMVDVTGMYNWYTGEIPAVNTRMAYHADDVVFSLEHLYRTDDLSLWTPRLDLYPDAKISFETYARYDDRANDVEEIAVLGYMNWCCLRYGLGYHFYDDREQRIMLSVGLSAFPKARISSGL